MEIIIEIGTEEQKEQIREELSCIEIIAKEIPSPLLIKQLIVPIDFDKKVNKLHGTNSYESRRATQIAMAKLVESNDGITFIFSPLLYTKGFDGQIRLLLYIHELIHAVNKYRFPQPILKSEATLGNFNNLYILFDEYDADRKAHKFHDGIFPSKTILFKKSLYVEVKSYLNSLIDDSVYYSKIKREISSFRHHGDVDLFSRKIYPYFDEASKAIIHIYSVIDHYPKLKNVQILMSKSKFINDKTLSLIDFFRRKHESNDADLVDGLYLIDDYMANFGMKFEDVPEGLYCHVLDI